CFGGLELAPGGGGGTASIRWRRCAMSKAYTAARVEMIEQPEPPQARKEEDVPILFLHDIERHSRQGDETLHVLNGIELALWSGQSVALVAPSGAGKSTLLHIA